VKEQVAEIVAAYVGHNTVSPTELPALIIRVSEAFATLGQVPAIATDQPLTPAVSVRRSVRPEAITCLDCGWAGQMLKRHLTVAHGHSVDEYRSRWSLPPDYPMVAKNYAARRSQLAKSIGLGRRGRK
jgi:predicted transcriptional regulator